MTIIERMSDAGAAQGIERAIWRTPAEQGEAGTGNSQAEVVGADAPAAAVTEQNEKKAAVWYGDPASARRLAKVVAAVRAQSAAVVGLTGSRSGVGVSVTSRELAGAVSSFGTKTLLMDLSRVEIVNSAAPEGFAGEATFLTLAAEVRPSLFVVEFDAAQHPSLTVEELQVALAHAVRSGFTVVVDLPPVLQTSGAPTPSIAVTGSAYDLVFLVCLSGEMNQKEVGACVETCRIVGLKLGGLILNDWRMPGSGLIAG